MFQSNTGFYFSGDKTLQSYMGIESLFPISWNVIPRSIQCTVYLPSRVGSLEGAGEYTSPIEWTC